MKIGIQDTIDRKDLTDYIPQYRNCFILEYDNHFYTIVDESDTIKDDWHRFDILKVDNTYYLYSNVFDRYYEAELYITKPLMSKTDNYYDIYTWFNNYNSNLSHSVRRLIGKEKLAYDGDIIYYDGRYYNIYLIVESKRDIETFYIYHSNDYIVIEDKYICDKISYDTIDELIKETHQTKLKIYNYDRHD